MPRKYAASRFQRFFKSVIGHKMTKTSKLLAAVLASLLVILVVGLLVHNHQGSTPHMFSEDELATATARNGEMSKQEALNLDRIGLTAEKQRLITDADLDWTLNLLKTPIGGSNPNAPALRRSNVLIVLKNVKSLTPAQKDKVYVGVSGLLTSSDQLDRIGAISIMNNIKDKRALPALTHLLEDTDPTVRSFAQMTIKKINS